MKQTTQLMIIMIFSIIAKFSGFIRQFLLARVFGISLEMDSFVLATIIITFFVGILTSGITNTFIPIYNEIDIEAEKKEFFKNIFIIMTFISLIMMILLSFYSKDILLLIIKNKEINLDLITKIFKILSLSIIFSLLSEVYAAYFQAIQSFTKLTYINFFMNLIVIIYLMYFYKFGIFGYSVAYLIMEITRFLFLTGTYYFMDIKDNKLTKNKKIDIKKIKLFFKLIIPIIFSTGVVQLNLLVDKIFASKLQEGTISTLEYTNKLIQLIIGVFILNYLMWLYPKLSLNIKKKIKNIESISQISLLIILIITIPACLFLNLFSKEIIYIIFGKKIEFKELLEIEYILKIYSPLVIMISIRELLLKIILAMKKNSKLIKINILMLIVNVVLNLLLINKFKILGLAIATIASTFIGIIYVYSIVKNEINLFEFKNILSIIKIILFNLFLFLFLEKIKTIIIINTVLKFILIILIFGVLYLFLIYISKVYKDIFMMKKIINKEEI